MIESDVGKPLRGTAAVFLRLPRYDAPGNAGDRWLTKQLISLSRSPRGQNGRPPLAPSHLVLGVAKSLFDRCFPITFKLELKIPIYSASSISLCSTFGLRHAHGMSLSLLALQQTLACYTLHIVLSVFSDRYTSYKV